MMHGPAAGFAKPLRQKARRHERRGSGGRNARAGGGCVCSTEPLESRLLFNAAHEAAATLTQTKPTPAKAAPVVTLPSTWQARPIAMPHYFQSGHRATGNSDSAGDTPNSNYAGSSTPYGRTPSQMRGAYGVGNISFGGISGDGAGQTIAIVDAYDDPNIASDLHNFDVYFDLPDPPSFTQLNQSGFASPLPGTDPEGPYSSTGSSTWEQEESLDVEWAHVIAPDANIILFEASNAGNGLFTAVKTARQTPGVTVVSMSWGGSETSSETSQDSDFTTPSGHVGAGGVTGGITFVVSTGDSGAYSSSSTLGVQYPAASPNVLAVGGTTLNVSGSTYSSETGWGNGTSSYNSGGSGGGISSYEPQPSYQAGIVSQSTSKRTTPDISIDANPNTGAPIYDSWDFGTSTPWVPGYEGGTSLAAPMWSGLVAIADQGRALAGLGSLNGATQALPQLYKLPASDFHDITSGNNGYAAGPGYDLVTGRGSPIASTLVPDLAGIPVVTALAVSPNPVPAGGTLTLTASGISDPNAGATLSSVKFYQESNGTTGLQTGTGGDTLVGTATSATGGSWSINFSTTGFATGSYTFYAVAADSSGNPSVPVSGTGTVQLGAPSIGTFSASPNPVTTGDTLALSASGIEDPNAGGSITGVNFYIESNGTAGLQTGTGGDTFVGSAVDSGGTWTYNASTSGLAPGTYTFYAVATDNLGQTSSVANSISDQVSINGITSEPVPAVLSVTPEGPDGNGVAAGSAADGQRSMETQIAVVFNEPVELTAGAFSLYLVNNYGSGANDGSADTAIPAGVLGTPTNPSGDGVTWIIPILQNGTDTTYSYQLKGANGGISGASLNDGVYQLGVTASDVTAAGGPVMASNCTSAAWHRLYGDVDNKQRDFNTEYSALLASYSSSFAFSGYNPDLDYEGDGRVFNTDYAQFLARFGSAKVYTEPQS